MWICVIISDLETSPRTQLRDFSMVSTLVPVSLWLRNMSGRFSMCEGRDSLEERTGCSCCWEKVQEAPALEGVSSTDAAGLKNEGL